MSERVAALIAAMTIEEKVAQLYGVWISASNDGAEVAPNQNEMTEEIDLDTLLPTGLGQLTRPFGTLPVGPSGRRGLAPAHAAADRRREPPRHPGARTRRMPRRLRPRGGGDRVPGAARARLDVVPRPRPRDGRPGSAPTCARSACTRDSRGARRRARRALGPGRGDRRRGSVPRRDDHDRLHPGRRRGAGVIATLKHFAGYAASRAGRNLAPVSIGPRELADVILPPFEMAVRESGARSVMNSYTDPRRRAVRPGIRRFSPGCSATPGDSTGRSSPTTSPSGSSTRSTASPPTGPTQRTRRSSPDRRRAPEQVLLQHGAHRRGPRGQHPRVPHRPVADPRPRPEGGARSPRSLLGRGPAGAPRPRSRRPWRRSAAPSSSTATRTAPSPADSAERSIVLLANDGTLPLGTAGPRRIALVGPDRRRPARGPRLLLVPAPRRPAPPRVRSRDRAPDAPRFAADGVPRRDDRVRARHDDQRRARPTASRPRRPRRPRRMSRSSRSATVPASSAAAPPARAATPRRSTCRARSRPCSTPSSRPERPPSPCCSRAAPTRSGTRSCRAPRAGRPRSSRPSSPARRGTPAVAGVLSGRVNPSGRLPVSVPARPGRPAVHLPRLDARAADGVSNIDPTPAFWFGHGISYTAFDWSDAALSAAAFEDEVGGRDHRAEHRRPAWNRGRAALPARPGRPRSCAPCSGSSATRGWRVPAGGAARVAFRVSADLVSFTGRDLRRIVEPGDLVLSFGRSAGELVAQLPVALTGDVREVDHTRRLHPVRDRDQPALGSGTPCPTRSPIGARRRSSRPGCRMSR